MKNPWEEQNDLLGFEAIGHTYTNLIQSLDTAKVISIEAGFGRGKTFFRKAWAEHLRQLGEVVVEIDVQQSDHSGDPVITFLGALVEALPREEKGKGEIAVQSAKKLGAIGARSVAKILLRSGADEVIELMTDKAIDELEDFNALDGIIKDLGEGLSKAAGQMIASQMAAEQVRRKEMPEQLSVLQTALTKDKGNNRVVILIDELDRCHPDYALAVLEAMKLVFCQPGFVFCLMVNADYLERLAQHRFGGANKDEKYMDKFVDIRLRLNPAKDVFKNAVIQLARELPLVEPFGEDNAFSVDSAAELAAVLATSSTMSMRKVERILYKVEMALRCYSNQPLDAPLLVFLAFNEASDEPLNTHFLPRAELTPEEGARMKDAIAEKGRRRSTHLRVSDLDGDYDRKILENMPELSKLPRERYRLPDNRDYKLWALVYHYLAPHYIPMHEDVLNAVAQILVDPDSD